MGEYAKFQGESVKIGTCEDLYYLRADQAHLVEAEPNSLDPMDRSIWPVLRFRFPFPSEDDVQPGCFRDHEHGFRIPSSWSLPPEYDDHGSVQFTAHAGYVLSIPCPEQYQQPGMAVEIPNLVHVVAGEDGEERRPLRVGRNGWNGGPRIVQQGYRDGQLRTIVQCGACGSKWNLSPEAAADVCAAILEEADAKEWTRGDNGQEQTNRHSDDTRREYAEMVRRILAGYALEEVKTA